MLEYIHYFTISDHNRIGLSKYRIRYYNGKNQYVNQKSTRALPDEMGSFYMTDKILKALEQAPRGDMSLEELGDITGLSRGTVSKYVGQLEQAGKVSVHPRGTMKL